MPRVHDDDDPEPDFSAEFWHIPPPARDATVQVPDDEPDDDRPPDRPARVIVVEQGPGFWRLFAHALCAVAAVTGGLVLLGVAAGIVFRAFRWTLSW